MPLAALVNNADPVSLEEMLAARETRAERQRELRERHGASVISFTLNIPGEYKAYPLAGEAFSEGMTAIDGQMRRSGTVVAERREHREKTGFEGYFAVDAEGVAVKKLAMLVENGHPLGRLFDIDVFGRDGAALRGADAGRGERKCLICGKPVWECARSRAHPAEELALRTAELIKEHFDAAYADKIAAQATRALLYEVAATPKPGLVDCMNNGSHADMTIHTFIDSSVVLTPYFRDLVRQGMAFGMDAGNLLPRLRFPGQMAEETMFAATGGVNTHKGLIFSLGIMCAAMGLLRERKFPPTLNNILGLCARIAVNIPRELAEKPADAAATHGEQAYERHGLTGARGEAASGFPHVRDFGYPTLKRMREKGLSLNDAGVIALLHIVSRLPDTNMVARSDLNTLTAVQSEVAALLEREEAPEQILAFARELDARFIAGRLSPGGSADLLALAYFLYFVLEENLR